MKKITLLIIMFLFCAATNCIGSMTTNSVPPPKGGSGSSSGGKDSTKFNWKGKQEVEFNAWTMNTVFNLPLIRFNINSLKGNRDPLGTLEYFNSVGAGITFSFGKINMKTDQPDLLHTLSRERTVTMKNIIGISLGCLFSKSDSTGGSRLIFTPNVCLQLLDFQVGYGYELGTVANPYHRSVLTLSYGIPLTKFTETGSYMRRKLVRKDNSGTSEKRIRGLF